MPLKEFKIKTSENEKLKRILKHFGEVIVIGEEGEQDLEKSKKAIEEKKARYKKLAGKANKVGEDVNELVKLGNREESWRDEQGE